MDNLIDKPFGTVAEMIHQHATAHPHNAALVEGDRALDYASLDSMMDRVATALQRDGVRPGEAIARKATVQDHIIRLGDSKGVLVPERR